MRVKRIAIDSLPLAVLKQSSILSFILLITIAIDSLPLAVLKHLRENPSGSVVLIAIDSLPLAVLKPSSFETANDTLPLQ